ncbi:glycine cleavage system protein R [Pseudohalioglobus lutimaris]|uniref:Glycine cleavage system transcriptional repressor n=1 Tax=Pseudohalioglobus lutimaris TaxID=1737061 RepID=A0A2N5X2T9_9GAMM|nr:ACT domain-containing protein [Pseudohalioglobus lutimaris]PLW68806.1 glycine cleavage system protein R [Pseudohalioglobus lutimaris]
MDASYIITFIGDDRPGLVEQLSSTIESNQGNWHESRLSQLGGKFAGLVLVSLPAGNAPSLETALKALDANGLSVRVTPAEGDPVSSGGKAITLRVLGPDRLGIVKEISRALASREINVVEMDSHVHSAAMSGEMLFQARIDAQVPQDLDMDNLHDTLDEIANQMTLDIDLE